MKVSFKLNAAQLIRVRAMAEHAVQFDESLQQFDSGNVLGWITVHPGSNTNVSLNITEDTLSFVGERCPLRQDGYIGVIKVILGTEDVVVTEYQTSDKRLAWDETLDDFFTKEVKAGNGLNFLNEVLEKATTSVVLGGTYCCLAVSLLENVKFFKPGTVEYRRQTAEGTPPSKELLALAVAMRKFGYEYA